MPGFENPFSGVNIGSTFSKLTGGADSKVVDAIQAHPHLVAGIIIICVVVIIFLLIALIICMNKGSGFGNGRNVGSGGRYNQLQRAQQFELPLSQPELDSFQAEQQAITGMPTMSSWNPPMENVYSGFGDKKIDPTVQPMQYTPHYPEGGNQEPFNDNVLKNIAYE